MADECTADSSVATSSTPPNWWDTHNHHHNINDHHPVSVSFNSHWVHQNPYYSNSSCEEDVSISTNHSGLTVDDSSDRNLLGDHASENQLWTQILLNIRNGVELHSNEQDIGASFLDTISSLKSMSTTGMFEPTAYSDYLRKMDTNNYNNDNNWDTFQNFKNNNGLITTTRSPMLENESLLKLWSIALPSPEANLRAGTVPSYGGLEPNCAVALQAGLEQGGSGGLFKRTSFRNQQFYDNASTKNFGDYISFNGRLAKPVLDIHVSSNPSFKSLNLSADTKKQIHQNSSPTRISGRGNGVSSEGKKKRSEESSEASLKKSKQYNSIAASNKMPQPKVKIGDKITALQQIVSPFGKTDTASVLTETIGYIKFLQEQVQLLSNPFMKTNCYKDPWQSFERKEAKGDGKIDLRSRGLCLVPISCTPQVYRENTGSDYWTPYRGCFYR